MIKAPLPAGVEDTPEIRERMQAAVTRRSKTLTDVLAYVDKRIAQYKARGQSDAAMALGVLRGDLYAGFHESEAAPADGGETES